MEKVLGQGLPSEKKKLWERRISQVVARASEIMKEATLAVDERSNLGLTYVGDMTVEQLERLIVEVVSLAVATIILVIVD